MKTFQIENSETHEEVMYFISGPYLKRNVSGDQEAYREIKKKWITPRLVAFGTAATAGGMYLPPLLISAALKHTTSLDIDVFSFAHQMLLRAPDFGYITAIPSVAGALVANYFTFESVFEKADEIALKEAKFEYNGINLDIATNDEIADFVGNKDLEIIENLKRHKTDDYDLEYENPLYETTLKPKTLAPPKYDFSGGGGDDAGD